MENRGALLFALAACGSSDPAGCPIGLYTLHLAVTGSTCDSAMVRMPKKMRV